VISGEYHNIDSTDWLNGLPTADCLKEMKIKKVDLALEGRRTGSVFSLQDELNRREQLEQVEYRAKKLRLTVTELIGRFRLNAPGDFVRVHHRSVSDVLFI
jgi:hypothetical protein